MSSPVAGQIHHPDSMCEMQQPKLECILHRLCTRIFHVFINFFLPLVIDLHDTKKDLHLQQFASALVLNSPTNFEGICQM